MEIGLKTDRQIANLVADLSDAGAIEVVRDQGQLGRGNRYRICFRPRPNGEPGFVIAEPMSDVETGSQVRDQR